MAEIGAWFGLRRQVLAVQTFLTVRTQVSASRVRVPDVVICALPIPDEEVFTTPPYLCVEVASPEDTMSAMQDRVDDYLNFGVPNIWVVDPWKHRGWSVTRAGWMTAADGIMRTDDGSVSMPLIDVLLP
jgi:Uma2 family endonuclease